MTDITIEQRAAHIEMLEWMLENLQSHGFTAERAALTAAIAALRLSAGADGVRAFDGTVETDIFGFRMLLLPNADWMDGSKVRVTLLSLPKRAAAPRHEPGEG